MDFFSEADSYELLYGSRIRKLSIRIRIRIPDPVPRKTNYNFNSSKKIKFSKKSNLDLIYSKKKNLILKQNNKFLKKKSKLKNAFFAMACFCTFTVYVLDPDPDSYVCIGSTFYDTNPDPRIRNRLTDLFL